VATEYQIIEDAPKYAEATAHLASWSGNYDQPTPFTLFMDLIGVSGEQFGGAAFIPTADPYRYNGHDVPRLMAELIDQRLGYMELGMLADALKEYSENPRGVTEWVETLISADGEEDSEDDA
jgi:hypothetical protein